MQTPAPNLEAVLFDLGGVLIAVDGVGRFARWLGPGTTAEEAWARWLASPSVRDFESGGCTPEEFSAAACAEFGLSVTPETFLDEFGRWPGSLYPGALELLRQLRGQRPRPQLACLSNSNAIHWAEMKELGVADLLDDCYLSHELGLLKPDPDVFTHVAERLDCEPDRVLFLDDNQVNVDGARAAGLVAERVAGASGAAGALRAHGVLRQ